MRQLVLFLISISVLLSCGGKTEKGEVSRLMYGIVMSVDDHSRIDRMDQTVDYLSKELGVKVDYFKGSDYAAVIEAMKTGKIDFASTGPFSYLIANSKAGAESLVATAYTDGRLNYYGSVIFTSAASDIYSLDQVKADPSKYSIAFSDPASTSGYLYPLSHLKSLGIDPNEDMKETLFAGGHTAGILSCISQKVDLACTTWSSLGRLAEKGRIEKDSYRVLWTSEEIPPSNIYVRKDLPQKYKDGIKEAFVNMKDNDPELMDIIKKQAQKDIIYVEVKDSVYADMRQLVNKELGGLLK